MTIESKNFIASEKDIETLAGEILDADQTAASRRGIYLKAAVATFQAEVKSPPRQRNVDAKRLTSAEIEEHLKVFEDIATRFHAAVMRVAEATVPAPDALLLRRRTTFSRSALSTIRGYIRAGNDLRAVAAHKVTKGALATPMRKRKPSVDQLGRRAGNLASELQKIAKRLVATDRAVALELLRPMLQQLAIAAGMDRGAHSSARRDSRRGATAAAAAN
jgi:hypothetical protein